MCKFQVTTSINWVSVFEEKTGIKDGGVAINLRGAGSSKLSVRIKLLLRIRPMSTCEVLNREFGVKIILEY